MQPGNVTENMLNWIHFVIVNVMPVAACAKKAEISTNRTGSLDIEFIYNLTKDLSVNSKLENRI